MIRISAFADEISQDPARTARCPVPTRHQVIEFRAIHGTNVLDLTDAQHAEFRELLVASGFGLSAIGSPIGKIRITEPFEEHLERFERAMELADSTRPPGSGSSASTSRPATTRLRIARRSSIG